MFFASPAWLLALIPWSAVAVWMLRGKRPRVAVPFIELWRGPVGAVRVTTSWAPPSVAVVAVLLAMLLAILAATGPKLRWPLGASQVAPAETSRETQNVAIVSLAARTTPQSQVMVTLRNDSIASRARLRVLSEQRVVERDVDLPPRGQSANLFFDLPALGPMVEAELVGQNDDFVTDNRASLTRQRGWPSVERRSPLPPEISRIIMAYQKTHPASDAGGRVLVADQIETLGGDAGVIAAQELAAVPSGAMEMREHPLTANLAAMKLQDLRAAASPGESWQIVATYNGRPLVAVRERPTRQVWIGFDARDFAATTDFVVLWTNALDWVGQGGEIYTATKVPAVISAKPKQANEKTPDATALDLSRPLVFAALACLVLAAACWPATRLTPQRAPHNVS